MKQNKQKKSKQLEYIKQIEKYECGPVAIANACVWAGQDPEYDKTKRWLKDVLHYHVSKGTHMMVFDLLLMHSPFTFPFKVVKKLYKHSVKNIKKELSKDRALIIIIQESTSHTGLLVTISKGCATLVNWGGKKVTKRISLVTLERWCHAFVCSYVIEKRK